MVGTDVGSRHGHCHLPANLLFHTLTRSVSSHSRTLTLYFHIPLAAVLLYWYRPYLFDQFTVGTTQAPPPPPHHATSDALVPPDPGHTDLSVKLSYSTLHMYETAAICSDSDICSNIGR